MAKVKLKVKKPDPESEAMSVLRKLDRSIPGTTATLRDMAASRELLLPATAGEYLAMLIEEADFSLQCALPKGGEPRSMFLDPGDLNELASAVRYSAKLWEAAARVKQLGVVPGYGLTEESYLRKLGKEVRREGLDAGDRNAGGDGHGVHPAEPGHRVYAAGDRVQAPAAGLTTAELAARDFITRALSALDGDAFGYLTDELPGPLNGFVFERAADGRSFAIHTDGGDVLIRADPYKPAPPDFDAWGDVLVRADPYKPAPPDFDAWGEDPMYDREDWKDDVDDGATNLGYWEWVEHSRAVAADRRAEDRRHDPDCRHDLDGYDRDEDDYDDEDDDGEEEVPQGAAQPGAGEGPGRRLERAGAGLGGGGGEVRGAAGGHQGRPGGRVEPLRGVPGGHRGEGAVGAGGRPARPADPRAGEGPGGVVRGRGQMSGEGVTDRGTVVRVFDDRNRLVAEYHHVVSCDWSDEDNGLHIRQEDEGRLIVWPFVTFARYEVLTPCCGTTPGGRYPYGREDDEATLSRLEASMKRFERTLAAAFGEPEK